MAFNDQWHNQRASCGPNGSEYGTPRPLLSHFLLLTNISFKLIRHSGACCLVRSLGIALTKHCLTNENFTIISFFTAYIMVDAS